MPNRDEVTIPEGPMLDMAGKPVDEADLIDPGSNPTKGQRRWRPLRDRFGDDFESA